jgi:hypothetical protein
MEVYLISALCLDTITQSEKILESISGEQHNNGLNARPKQSVINAGVARGPR